jgi:hypothetical protein
VSSGGEMIKDTFSYFTTPSKRPRGLGHKARGVSTGYYKGNFKKPSRKGTKTWVDKFASTGVHVKTEYHGGINDPDCCYLIHSTYNVLIARAIAQALCRSLLRKAGIDCSNHTTTITSDTTMFLIADYQNLNSTAVPLPQETSLTAINLQTMAAGLETALIGIMDGFDGQTIPVRLRIQSQQTSRVTLADMDLTNEIVEVKITSRIAIQNRTKSDTGSLSTDVVDNQPLKGYRYSLSGGVPSIKDRNITNINDPTIGPNQIQTSLERIRDTGLMLVRGAQIDFNYREPPEPKYVSNCRKASKVMLQPGEIKTGFISHSFRGYFRNILERHLTGKSNNVATAQKRYLNTPGKSEMFAFEELLNSGSANLILLNYESEYHCGARTFSIKKHTMLSNFNQSTFSNFTP